MRRIKGGVILILFLLAVSGTVAEAREYSPEEHTYTDWIVTLEPTCTELGERYKECIMHGGKIIEELAMTGHQYELEVVESTCTENGRHIYTCSSCGDSYEEEGEEADGHGYAAEVTREAACGQPGTETFICTRCGDTYAEEIPMLIHSYGEWQIESEAKPGIPGSKYQECADCQERIYKEIPALPVPEVEEEPKTRLTVLNVVVITADVGIFAVFFVFIQMDIALILWARKQRKKYEEVQNKIRKYGDGCGFH